VRFSGRETRLDKGIRCLVPFHGWETRLDKGIRCLVPFHGRETRPKRHPLNLRSNHFAVNCQLSTVNYLIIY
jgi:hypothetical protein